MTIEITQENALKALSLASKEMQPVLKALFGGDVKPKPITERVKTFEDIESIAGVKLSKRSDETDDEFAYRQAKLIAKVYNEETVLNPADRSQYKYFPWFKITDDKLHPSGVGLSCDVCDDWSAAADFGVRLCFKSAQLAIDAGQKFAHIYCKLLIH
jgi:hypothetical protein